MVWGVLMAVPLLGGVRECEPGGPAPAMDGGPAPCVCPEIYAPVCGVDGVTYSNACRAECAGTKVAHEGECERRLCLADADCHAGERCNHDECLSNCRPGEPCLAVCYGACEAAAPRCEPVACRLHCEHGWARDEQGCEICECAPPPGGAECPPVCEIHCEHGNVLDENGCPTCACLPPPGGAECPPVCDIYCEHGNVPDENGCPTCECLPGPGAER